MKTRNKVIIGGGIISSILLMAGLGFSLSNGPRSDSCGGFHPRFHDRGFFSGSHHKDRAEFILWRMDKKAKELNLTPEQQAKYEVIKGNVKSHFSEDLTERQQLKNRFQQEMSKEDPDIKNLVEVMKTKMKAMSGFVEKNLDLLVDFVDSLDRNQKRLINDEIKERMKVHHS
jgi:hypothetical protein